MARKLKVLLILSSLIFVVFSCSCLFGKVTNTANVSNTINASKDEVIPVNTAVPQETAQVFKRGNIGAAKETAVETVKETVKETPTQAAAVTTTPKPKATHAVIETRKKPAATPVKTKRPSTGDPKIDTLLDDVTAAQKDRKGLKMKMTMRTTQGRTEPQVIKGDVIIRKPDKFRVHYTEPSEQIMISDGKSIWVYTPALNQVVKQSVKGADFNTHFYIEMENSLGFFSSNSKTTMTEDDSQYNLNMIPENKKDLNYDLITARILKKDLVPVYISMKYDETLIEVEFSDITYFSETEAAASPELANKNFKFTAPEGVEVIEAEELMKGISK